MSSASRPFVATLAGTTIITFLALEILPGDPARVILGVDAPDSAVQALREQLGLERPALERYLDWVSSLATGRFADSYTYSVPVDELLAARLEITVPLALLAMALSVAMAMTLGIFAAAHHNRRGDVAVMGVSQLGISVPNFWLGPAPSSCCSQSTCGGSAPAAFPAGTRGSDRH